MVFVGKSPMLLILHLLKIFFKLHLSRKQTVLMHILLVFDFTVVRKLCQGFFVLFFQSLHFSGVFLFSQRFFPLAAFLYRLKIILVIICIQKFFRLTD